MIAPIAPITLPKDKSFEEIEKEYQERYLTELADRLKILLANPARLKICHILLHEPEGTVSVCDLVERLERLEQPTISHHIRFLRSAGFLEAQKVGLFMYYRVDVALVRATLEEAARYLGVSLNEPEPE